MELDCFCAECLEDRNNNTNVDHKYQLYGVVVHLGVTTTSGHYISYARLFDEKRQPHERNRCHDCCQLKIKPIQNTVGNNETANGFWYILNDEKINVIPESEFQAKINREGSNNTPYILFYIRNDAIKEICTWFSFASTNFRAVFDSLVTKKNSFLQII